MGGGKGEGERVTTHNRANEVLVLNVGVGFWLLGFEKEKVRLIIARDFSACSCLSCCLCAQQ